MNSKEMCPRLLILQEVIGDLLYNLIVSCYWKHGVPFDIVQELNVVSSPIHILSKSVIGISSMQKLASYVFALSLVLS